MNLRGYLFGYVGRNIHTYEINRSDRFKLNMYTNDH